MLKFKKNILLSEHTTFRIGGLAKYFCTAKNKEDIIEAVKWAKEKKLPFFILGNGSNVLFSDKGFNGLVIKIENCKLKIENYNIYAGAGTEFKKLAMESLKESLTGLEWATGIPGTVGGAVWGNAQAFGGKISDLVESVETLDAKTLKIKTFSKRQCSFSTKNSAFKKNKNLIIISCCFRLRKGDKEKMEKKIKKYLSYRREHQPLNFPSAGSVFINPKSLSAGYLIEECGLKGKRIGNAQISEKHANFIVNLGGAKAKDVLGLIKIAKKKVREKFGIILKEEIKIKN